MNPYILAILLAVGFASGWQVKTWQTNSAQLIAEEAARKIAEKELDRESKIAASVEKRLQELRANERVIETRIPQIIDRPVYRAECIDNDGLAVINGQLLPGSTD